MKYLLKVTNKPFLLDPNIKSDSPVSVYKSLRQIWAENYHWILILLALLVTICALIITTRNKSKKNNHEEDIVQVDPFEEAISAIELEEFTFKKSLIKIINFSKLILLFS